MLRGPSRRSGPGHDHPCLAWSLIALICLCLIPSALSQEFLNVSIPLNSTQIVYTPFLCNATAVSTNPQRCAGAWQVSDSDPATISTFGPSSTSNNIIPQFFFSFRAFELHLTTSPSSNATVNVTVSSNGIVVSSVFNSSVGSVSIVNLPENDTSVMTINYISSSIPTRLDLEALEITVLANATITSFLPTPTLPISISLPTFTTPSSTLSSSATSTSNAAQGHGTSKKMIAEAVGLTVGLGLGLTIVATLIFYYWRRRRRREADVPMEATRSGWSGRGR
ncbi:hypothetical protein D9613_007176 [Agrocybe pediades]|uniref:Mid2 domain-containing protein n=1 Tax=Agrocybe pediades TaxID=84607 RepID=A0A8H4QIR9_9AGAR|nr:hypothetical protein D9613_007176 [Agrocybe pediades]